MNVSYSKTSYENNISLIYMIKKYSSKTWLLKEDKIILIDSNNNIHLNYSYKNNDFCYTDSCENIIKSIENKLTFKEKEKITQLLKNTYSLDLEKIQFNLLPYKKSLEKKYNVNIQLAIEAKYIERIWIFKELKNDLETYYIFSYNIFDNKRNISSDFFIVEKPEDLQEKMKDIEDIIDYYYAPKEFLGNPKNYSLLFDSCAAGILFHEFLGHLLEEDYFYKSFLKLKKKHLIDKSLKVYENYNCFNKLDDLGRNVIPNLLLIYKGEVINNISSNSTNILYSSKSTGNNIQGENNLCLYPRMRHMYIDSDISKINKEKILDFVKDGIYIKKINMGEVNTFTGDFSVEVQMSYLIKNNTIVNKIEPFFLNFHIEDFKGKSIFLSDDYKTYYNLCGKNGAIVKVAYTTPSIVIKNI